MEILNFYAKIKLTVLHGELQSLDPKLMRGAEPVVRV